MSDLEIASHHQQQHHTIMASPKWKKIKFHSRRRNCPWTMLTPLCCCERLLLLLLLELCQLHPLNCIGMDYSGWNQEFSSNSGRFMRWWTSWLLRTSTQRHSRRIAKRHNTASDKTGWTSFRGSVIPIWWALEMSSYHFISQELFCPRPRVTGLAVC